MARSVRRCRSGVNLKLLRGSTYSNQQAMLCMLHGSRLCRQDSASQTMSTQVQDESDAAAALRKQKAVDARELDWVNHHLRVEKQDGGGGGGGGFLRGMIDTIIGNLQLSITNIHVRYEVSSC